MQINIRNGIINAETNPPFISLSGNSVNLNAVTPITIAFAYGTHDYIFTELSSVNAAWTVTSGQYWLYWDINLNSGVRTFGSTRVNPASYTNGYGFTLPPNPQQNQIFFDYNTQTTKYWNGARWVTCLRVFAASVNGNLITPYPINQSQVGLYAVKNAGYITFNTSSNPITSIDSNGLPFFVTTEHLINTQLDPYNSYKIDALMEQAQALQAIPKYYCVSLVGPNQIGLSSYLNYQNPCIGISVDIFGAGDIKNIVTHGYITDNVFFNFTNSAGYPLFVGPNGEITLDVPSMYSLQQIGYVVSESTIFIDIENLIVIEDNIITPTPSVTPSITPTISTSLTPSPTVTPTTTQTLTITPSSTVTPTVSLTPSITPTITPSATATITPTTTLTPSRTATVTPTTTAAISLTPTSSVTPSQTMTVTPTNSVTPSRTATVTPTTTATISLTPTSSVTPSQTMTVTPTTSVTPSQTATVTPSNTATISLTPTSSVTPSQTMTVTPTVTPSVS